MLDPAPQVVAEPRGLTTIDLIVGTIGVACACALPRGVTWSEPGAKVRLDFSDWAVMLLWVCCLAAVALSFVTVARHARYRRTARPAEWLIFSVASCYIASAISRLHADYGHMSRLVSSMESSLEADMGYWGRVALTMSLFLVIAGYVAVLMRHGKLAPFLTTLLGISLLLFWFWGPCDVVRLDPEAPYWPGLTSTMYIGQGRFWQVFLMGELIPSLPLILVPLVFMYWVIFSRPPVQSSAEFAGVILCSTIAALLYFHPNVYGWNGWISWFIVEVAVFALVCQLVAAPIGWGVSRVTRISAARIADTSGS